MNDFVKAINNGQKVETYVIMCVDGDKIHFTNEYTNDVIHMVKDEIIQKGYNENQLTIITHEEFLSYTK